MLFMLRHSLVLFALLLWPEVASLGALSIPSTPNDVPEAAHADPHSPEMVRALDAVAEASLAHARAQLVMALSSLGLADALLYTPPTRSSSCLVDGECAAQDPSQFRCCGCLEQPCFGAWRDIGAVLRASKVHPRKHSQARRLLRAVASMGWITLDEAEGVVSPSIQLVPLQVAGGKQFQQHLDQCPCVASAPSLSALLDLRGTVNFSPWAELANSMKFLDDETPFERTYEASPGEYFGEHPDEAGKASRSYDQVVSVCEPWLVQFGWDSLFDFDRGEYAIVDAGAGTGARFLRRLLDRLNQPQQLRAVAMDLPGVLGKVEPSVSAIEVNDGNMFEAIPSGDVILLKNILHACSDADAVQILQNARRAISKSGVAGRVVILERTADSSSFGQSSFEDLNLMVVSGGRDRFVPDFEKLLKRAGLKLEFVEHTPQRAPSLCETSFIVASSSS